MPQGFVYILQSKKNLIYYIGSSTDVDSRLTYHNKGWVIATKNKGPWEIKFIHNCPTIKEARQIEHKLKKMKSRKIIEQIILEQCIKLKCRGVAQLASAPRLGRGGRRFESCHPDH